jgi:pimeloyl-ACP methyl ester carboxylesterase
MSEFREHTVQCISTAGLHRMAYTEWGDPANPKVLICVHGLSRVGRDFDDLARVLAADYRVVCPDVVGRGNSEWLADPRLYAVPQYVSDMVTLIARLDVPNVHWLGTSMGGLIGMGLAALPKTPVTKLVLNDVGPVIKAVALKRIGEYLGSAPDFPDLTTAQAYVTAVSSTFGLKTSAQWRRITEVAVKANGNGYKMHYDPAISVPFKEQNAGAADLDIWPYYEAVRCPTLVIRGALSDMLDHDTLLQMAARGPKAQTAEIAGVGHAPMFMEAEQIDVVKKFLLQN